MFTDRVVVQFSAGKGGNGVIAWRREKFVPKGGPTGGNGGNGGSVILEADAEIYSLDWYRNRKLIKAENGRDGGASSCHGRKGADLILKVPCGTLVKDVETGEILHDFTEDKERFILCQGGKGGRGNETFKTPTNRAPNICTPGTFGAEKKIELELKLIADIGLVGFPNAGKSTLISSLAGLRVKVAPYPFTTLQPNLGFIELPDYKRLYLADIPGIIEGASEDRGLGLEFLRHIERTKLLIFVLDASGIDGRTALDDFHVLRKEIGSYSAELLDRPFLIALNKIDTEESKEQISLFKKKHKNYKDQIFEISAANRIGLEPLVEEITNRLVSRPYDRE